MTGGTVSGGDLAIVGELLERYGYDPELSEDDVRHIHDVRAWREQPPQAGSPEDELRDLAVGDQSARVAGAWRAMFLHLFEAPDRDYAADDMAHSIEESRIEFERTAFAVGVLAGLDAARNAREERS
jgi:hypothetical protein